MRAYPSRSNAPLSVVWGIGMALHEETLIDHNFGRVMNANIAEYHVPVHADVHDIKVIFVEEPDSKVNLMGIKGVGEIGIVGVCGRRRQRHLSRDRKTRARPADNTQQDHRVIPGCRAAT